MSLLRAYDYNQAVYSQQYIENTHIMNFAAFKENLQNFKALAEKKVSSFVLLEVDCSGRTLSEMDSLLLPKIRANDILGQTEDGKLQILLSNATEKDLPFILPRFENLGLDITVIK
jgi:hypothetical protein